MDRRKNHVGSGLESLSIGALSRAARIPVETLRTWERRYGVPAPARKPSGHRLYPLASVDHLRRVATLLNRGHRPAEVLGLSASELDSLLSLSEPSTRQGPPSPTDPQRASSVVQAIQEMLRAARELDREALVRELRANWIRLGPLRFLQECAGPFMTQIGAAWEKGALDVRHEHFAWACLDGFLREVRAPYDDRARAPRIVAATLEGDMHEGGLLMAAVVMAVRGGRVVYLGINAPSDQIAAAARAGDADVVAISISSAVARSRAAKAVAALRGKLPRRVLLWVGGAGAQKAVRGVERFESLEALDRRLGDPL